MEENTIQVSENEERRKIFKSERDEVIGK